MGVGRLEIAVCGCGPAGLAAALLLHRAGHRVVMFERFVTPQPLGSGLMLQPTGLAILGHLGLGDEIAALGHRVDRMYGRAVRSGRIVLDVRYGALGAEQAALSVHRAALFNTLFRAVVRESITIEGGIEITGIERVADGRPVVIDRKCDRRSPFDLVVDALGTRSPLMRHAATPPNSRELAYGALWTTLPWPDAPFARNTLEQRYDCASVMLGVLPVGLRDHGEAEQTAFFWSLRGVDYAAWRNDGLKRWKERVASLWPETSGLLAQISDPDQLTLARYSHHTMARPVGARIAFVGDSAHATSPQLGQGANMALLDVFALSEALSAEKDLAAALGSYCARRRFHVRFYQALSALFTPFYQSDSKLLPTLRDLMFAPVTKLPGMPKLLAGMVSGTLGLSARSLPRGG